MNVLDPTREIAATRVAGNESTRARTWAILLAGGDGARLLGRTVRGVTLDRPKQFCRIGGERTLLGQAVHRAARLVPPDRVVPVVSAAHRAWWQPELRGLPGRNVLEQPGNRGNAIAVLHALFHVLRAGSDPLVAVLPSDHAVEDEAAMSEAIRSALREAERTRDRVVLLGIAPDAAESGYGWIVPGPATGVASPVRAFVEKPARETAAELLRQGALWNSFIFASTATGLLGLFRATQPELLATYLRHRESLEPMPRALAALFAQVEAKDLSRDLLEHAPERLAVIRARPCGWTDLGTPERLAAWLDGRDAQRSPPVPLRTPTAARRESLVAGVTELV